MRRRGEFAPTQEVSIDRMRWEPAKALTDRLAGSSSEYRAVPRPDAAANERIMSGGSVGATQGAMREPRDRLQSVVLSRLAKCVAGPDNVGEPDRVARGESDHSADARSQSKRKPLESVNRQPDLTCPGSTSASRGGFIAGLIVIIAAILFMTMRSCDANVQKTPFSTSIK